jgi:sugar phosphate isomerase/epimerase
MQIVISGTELEPTETVAELISCASKLDISFVELWYPRNTETEGLEQVLHLIFKAGLRVACVSTGSELYRNGGSLEDQELLIEAINLASRIGAPFTNTYFGYHEVQDDAAATRAYRQLLEPCLARATELGITIVLENEFNAFGWDHAASDITRRPLALRRLFEEINNPSFRLNFDPCNFYCAGAEPYPYAYELLRPFIGYVHVKDGCHYDAALANVANLSGWKRFTDFGKEFITRPMGDGAVPWVNLLRRLYSDGYTGFLTIEPHAEIGLRHEAWRQSVEYIRCILPEMELSKL